MNDPVKPEVAPRPPDNTPSDPKYIQDHADLLHLDSAHPGEDSEFDDGDGDGGDEGEYSPNRVVHLKVGLVTLTVEGGSEAETKSLLTAAVTAAASLHEIDLEQIRARFRARSGGKTG